MCKHTTCNLGLKNTVTDCVLLSIFSVSAACVFFSRCQEVIKFYLLLVFERKTSWQAPILVCQRSEVAEQQAFSFLQDSFHENN